MWFKIDDQLHSHPKTLAAGNEAMGLWVRLGSWSSAHLTDGLVPHNVVELFDRIGSATESLVLSGWMAEKGAEGYQLHDYLDWNPSAKEVKALRKKRAAAGRKGGSNSKATAKQTPSKTGSKTASKSEAQGTGTGTGTGTLQEGAVWALYSELRAARWPATNGLLLTDKRRGHIAARLGDFGLDRVMAATEKFCDPAYFWGSTGAAKDPDRLFRSTEQFEKVESSDKYGGSGQLLGRSTRAGDLVEGQIERAKRLRREEDEAEARR